MYKVTNKSGWNQVAIYGKIKNKLLMGAKEMKKTSYFVLLLAMTVMPANASRTSRQFVSEVSRGADVVNAEHNVNTPDVAPGELGGDVYQSVGVVDSSRVRMFIPTDMYMRAGGGLNLGFATDKASCGDVKHKSEDGYTVQLGLGWNLSSYVRTEIDFQTTTLKFAHLKNFNAEYKTLGAMLYFDFARRYVMDGDVTRMRHFVPFMGIGAGFGHYDFEGGTYRAVLIISATLLRLFV